MSVQLTATRATDDGPHLAPSTAAHVAISALPPGSDLETELDAMVTDLRNVAMDLPDEVMRLCQAFMARCTEIHIQLARLPGNNRSASHFRTAQLAKVIELIEFTFKTSSRTVEIRRQDVELSK